MSTDDRIFLVVFRNILILRAQPNLKTKSSVIARTILICLKGSMKKTVEMQGNLVMNKIMSNLIGPDIVCATPSSLLDPTLNQDIPC